MDCEEVHAREWASVVAKTESGSLMHALAGCTSTEDFAELGYTLDRASIDGDLYLEDDGSTPSPDRPTLINAYRMSRRNHFVFSCANGETYKCEYHREESVEEGTWEVYRAGRTEFGPPAHVSETNLVWRNEEGLLHNLFGPSRWSTGGGPNNHFCIHGTVMTKDDFDTQCEAILAENPSLRPGRLVKAARASE